LVTGGSKGIGRAVIEALAANGANVIINYAHDEVAAKEAVKNISKHGVKSMIVQADIAKQSDIDAMFAK
jgi:3-oxoacyl-[acyl-carrier protein] reductase